MAKKHVRYKMDFTVARRWMAEGLSCRDCTRTTYKQGSSPEQLINVVTGATVPVSALHELSEWVCEIEATPAPEPYVKWPVALQYIEDGGRVANWHGDSYELREGRLWMRPAGMKWEPCIGFDDAAGVNDHDSWFVQKVGRSGVIGQPRTYDRDEYVEVPLPPSPPAPLPRKLMLIIDLSNHSEQARQERARMLKDFIRAGLIE